MKLRYLSICLFVLIIGACGSEDYHGGENNTLQYSYTTVKEKAPTCPANTDNGCSIIKFLYPVFKDEASLNDTVTHKLAVMFPVFNNTRTNFHDIAKSFFVRYKSFLTVDPQKPALYPLSEYAKVVKQENGLTTIETGGYLLAMAHPVSNISFINWDTKTHKKIVLDDLLKPGYKDSLNRVAEVIFRKNEGLTNEASLAPKYNFKGNKFTLNNNFIITPVGLRFLFNEGEIKAREEGFVIIVIPYATIQSSLKPQTVVAQYYR
jgi:hypothetical protein